MVVAEVGFEEEPEDDEPEPLTMEHFYFPLGLWLAGLGLSIIFLLAEISFFNCCCSRGRTVEAGEATQLEQNTAVEKIEDSTL